MCRGKKSARRISIGLLMLKLGTPLDMLSGIPSFSVAVAQPSRPQWAPASSELPAMETTRSLRFHYGIAERACVCSWLKLRYKNWISSQSETPYRIAQNVGRILEHSAT